MTDLDTGAVFDVEIEQISSSDSDLAVSQVVAAIRGKQVERIAFGAQARHRAHRVRQEHKSSLNLTELVRIVICMYKNERFGGSGELVGWETARRR